MLLEPFQYLSILQKLLNLFSQQPHDMLKLIFHNHSAHLETESNFEVMRMKKAAK